MKVANNKSTKKQTLKTSANHVSILPANVENPKPLPKVYEKPTGEIKGSKQYKRFSLKAKVLKTLQLSDIAMTCRELNDTIAYKGSYSSFRVQLSKYIGKGYITPISHQTPRKYELTKYGRMNAKDVYFSVKDKQRRAQEKAIVAYQGLLKDDERFMAGVERFAAGEYTKTPEIEYVEVLSPTISHEYPPDPSKVNEINQINPINPISQIKQLQQQVQELKNNNHKLKFALSNTISLAKEKINKDLQEEKDEKAQVKKSTEQERINKRKDLLHKYIKFNGKIKRYYCDPLPSLFFREWNYRVVLLMNSKLFSEGSYDIVSEQEFKREAARGHVKRELTAKEVKEYRIIPVKSMAQGIEVQSRKTGDRKMLYY
ncbi:hypothetical protein [Methanococcoides alaskense]|uniref:Regulator of replication initiation timing n=1 Tax=Methanococcoides alaskense TaxID=325778 RepID=A0AA90TX11_9EURY|nr:hypothetical protein [Methanococcoides alaskense]MDA0525442.1 hypothetical protein [Methanococcoides alaskense]MDR6221625.1 regulator of replication initiation timing [Methanococcoides alaskense]